MPHAIWSIPEPSTIRCIAISKISALRFRWLPSHFVTTFIRVFIKRVLNRTADAVNTSEDLCHAPNRNCSCHQLLRQIRSLHEKS